MAEYENKDIKRDSKEAIVLQYAKYLEDYDVAATELEYLDYLLTIFDAGDIVNMKSNTLRAIEKVYKKLDELFWKDRIHRLTERACRVASNLDERSIDRIAPYVREFFGITSNKLNIAGEYTEE